MKVPKPRKLKSGVWFIQLRLDGVSIPVTAATDTECIRQAELIKAEHRNGKKIAKHKKAGEKTLQEVLDDFVKDNKATLSPSTLRSYESYKNNRFPQYRKKRLNDIKWQTMINDELENASEKTVSNAWGLVRPALKHAGYPVPEVKLAAVPVNEIAFLQPDEILKFCKELKGRSYEIPLLLQLHGICQSELQALTWENVDLDHGYITVHGAEVRKTGGAYVAKKQNKNRNRTRQVPIMIPQLSEALKACETKEGKVCRLKPNSLLDDVKRACKRAGITEVTCHGLRHSFASLCYRQGVNERQTMSWGGWADYHTMHKIYIRLSAVGETEAQAKFRSFFEAVKEEKKAENANKNAN